MVTEKIITEVTLYFCLLLHWTHLPGDPVIPVVMLWNLWCSPCTRLSWQNSNHDEIYLFTPATEQLDEYEDNHSLQTGLAERSWPLSNPVSLHSLSLVTRLPSISQPIYLLFTPLERQKLSERNSSSNHKHTYSLTQIWT